MSHDAVCRYHYRGISKAWLTAVTVWLFFREGVAKSPCKCGSGGGIYTERAIRPFTVGRANWHIIDTVHGAEASAMVYSLGKRKITTRLASDYWI